MPISVVILMYPLTLLTSRTSTIFCGELMSIQSDQSEFVQVWLTLITSLSPTFRGISVCSSEYV